MEMNFCRRCGESLIQKAESYWSCANKHSTYLNASPTAGVFFINNANAILLSVRGIEPGKGLLDSIGGFVDADESAEDSVIREIEEETGLTENDFDELRIFCTAPAQYRFEDEDRPVLSTFFWSHLNVQAKPIAQDDVADLVWVSPDDIDVSKFSGEDVKIAVTKLVKLIKENRV